MKTTSRYPAVAKRRQPAQLGSGPAVMIAGSLLAVTVFFQSPAHSAETTFAGLAAEEAGVARSSVDATKIAELEKQFWICDYIGTTRGIEGPHGVACGAITRN